MGLFDFFKRRRKGKISQNEFAELVTSTLKQDGFPDELDYDPDRFELRILRDGEEAGVVSLHNVYRSYVETDENERAGILANVVEMLMTQDANTPDDFSEARPNLRAKIWSRFALEYATLRARLDDAEPFDLPSEPLGDHLLVAPVYDLPNAMKSVRYEDLEKWGVSHYEVMEHAKRNLAEGGLQIAQVEERVFLSVTGDSYDSSRILLAPLFSQLKLDGDPVAILPTRDSMMVTGADDIRGLEILADLASKELEEPRPMSGIPLRLVAGEWIEWLPDESHPLFKQYRALEIRTLGEVYGQQRDLLIELLEKRGEDVFVASYSAVEREESGLQSSYCVWAQGVDSLLPRTHLLAFVSDRDEESLLVPWDVVERVAGNLMEPTDWYPERIRVRRAPSASQLEEIREHAI